MTQRRMTIEPSLDNDFLSVKMWINSADPPLEVWKCDDSTSITRRSLEDAESKIKKLWGLFG